MATYGPYGGPKTKGASGWPPCSLAGRGRREVDGIPLTDSVGLKSLRFPHSQIRYEPAYVKEILLGTIASAESGLAGP